MPKFNQRKNMNLKLVYCVRNDLKMGKGKIAAQVGHATLGIYKKNLREKRNDVLEKWITTSGEAKIVLKINSEREMMKLKERADEMKMCTHIVTDAGHTQVDAGSNTVLCIGPDLETRLTMVTGHLKLL